MLHSLTKTIGIQDWLVRAVDAAVISGSKIDKPNFSFEVNMKFAGSGSYTYTFPPGTDLVTLSGFYQLDEILNVNLIAKTPIVKITAVTLPPNGKAFEPRGTVVPSVVNTLQDTRGNFSRSSRRSGTKGSTSNSSGRVMPDAIFQTTLLVLYFIAPAVTVDLATAPNSTFDRMTSHSGPKNRKKLLSRKLNFGRCNPPIKSRPRIQTCALPTACYSFKNLRK